MTRLPIYIIIAITLSLTYACGQHQDTTIANSLRQASVVLDTMPDSTLSIIRHIDFSNIRDKHLLAEANYLEGTAKMKMSDYPGAITPLLHAEKTAGEIGDMRILKMSCRQIMSLYDSVSCTYGVVKYAMRTLRAYEADNDSSGLFEAFDDALLPIFWAQETDSLNYIINSMSRFAETCTDSVKTGKLAIARSLLNSLSDGMFSKPILGSEKLLDSINDNCDWKSLISSDENIIYPSDILKIFNILTLQNKTTLAQELIDAYTQRYAPDKQAGFNGLIRLDILFEYEHPAYAIILNRNTFFNLMLPQIEKASIDFYYNEKVIKNQTIKYQRKILWITVISCVLFVMLLIVAGLSLHQRRKRRNEEMIQSAIELKSALHSIQDKWIVTLANLCNTYYDAHPGDLPQSKVAANVLASIHDMSNSSDFYPMLERKLNHEHDNIMKKFRDDMPGLRDDEYHLFILNALRLSIPTISMLLDEKRALIYSRRARLRAKIQESSVLSKDLYLDCLA